MQLLEYVGDEEIGVWVDRWLAALRGGGAGAAGASAWANRSHGRPRGLDGQCGPTCLRGGDPCKCATATRIRRVAVAARFTLK